MKGGREKRRKERSKGIHFEVLLGTKKPCFTKIYPYWINDRKVL